MMMFYVSSNDQIEIENYQANLFCTFAFSCNKFCWCGGNCILDIKQSQKKEYPLIFGQNNNWRHGFPKCKRVDTR